MRIISINTNGIRAAARKGFFEWMLAQDADFICIQETKAQLHKLTSDVFYPEGYELFYNEAQKPGYSGVAIYSRHQPKKVVKELGWSPADEEGRYLQLDFPQLSVVSLYMPSGSSGEIRQNVKFEFLDYFEEKLKKIKRSKREFVICGDWNTVHKRRDITNWNSNQKNSGCLPEERAWLDKVFNQLGFVDGFREVNQEAGEYTWWSNRGQAWAKNVGWRIDYQVVTPGLAEYIQDAWVYRKARFSDHAPLVMDYDFKVEL